MLCGFHLLIECVKYIREGETKMFKNNCAFLCCHLVLQASLFLSLKVFVYYVKVHARCLTACGKVRFMSLKFTCVRVCGTMKSMRSVIGFRNAFDRVLYVCYMFTFFYVSKMLTVGLLF